MSSSPTVKTGNEADENQNVISPSNQEERMIKDLTAYVKSPVINGEDLKKREESIIELGNILARGKRTKELGQMIKVTRPFLVTLGKAKAARMVRDLIDLSLKIDLDGDIKVSLVEESIEWANSQNHVFLRQALEARLIRLLGDLGRYPKAMQSADKLIRELRKVDDKDLLLEVYLEESKACYSLASLSKARASLTSARTIANSTYVIPSLQAGLDMQSGILHAADERDFQTAFSYFYEAFEGYDLMDQQQEAMLALKYMLLSKVMLDKPEEIQGILSHKNALKYGGNDISAILAVGKAAKNRSLKEFNEAFGHYREELQCDPVVRTHFGTLSDTMLEKELCRLIEPYSFVQIDHVAEKIGLPREKVEKKLAQMILDQKFSGSLCQGDGMLIVFGEIREDKTYDLAVNTVHAMNEVVDVLYKRAQLVY